eukprot:TRINITY_DN65342_c0_g1_i1.p1 TRINITY_DN65342_c0_g1~~TRINITY_DN65342_c0_g1_i1.p1  ORF type:complete len:686 (+),score=158.54 TRINITY_DN65342_c0_g1_i1:81-2060(+)
MGPPMQAVPTYRSQSPPRHHALAPPYVSPVSAHAARAPPRPAASPRDSAAAVLHREHLMVLSPRDKPPRPRRADAASTESLRGATSQQTQQTRPHLRHNGGVRQSPAPPRGAASPSPSRQQSPRTSARRCPSCSPRGTPQRGAASAAQQALTPRGAEVVFDAVRRHWYSAGGLPSVIADVREGLQLPSDAEAITALETVLGTPIPAQILQEQGVRHAPVAAAPREGGGRQRSLSPQQLGSRPAASAVAEAQPAAESPPTLAPVAGSPPQQRNTSPWRAGSLPRRSVGFAGSVAEAVARRWAAFVARDVEGATGCYTERSQLHQHELSVAFPSEGEDSAHRRTHCGLEGARRFHRLLLGAVCQERGLKAQPPQIDEGLRHAVVEWECPGAGILRVIDTFVFDEGYRVAVHTAAIHRRPRKPKQPEPKPAGAPAPAAASRGTERSTGGRSQQRKGRPGPEPFSDDPRLRGRPLSESPKRAHTPAERRRRSGSRPPSAATPGPKPAAAATPQKKPARERKTPGTTPKPAASPAPGTEPPPAAEPEADGEQAAAEEAAPDDERAGTPDAAAPPPEVSEPAADAAPAESDPGQPPQPAAGGGEEEVDIEGTAEEEVAATRIQAVMRGRKTRREAQEKREEASAATKIQARFRGHKARVQLRPDA